MAPRCSKRPGPITDQASSVPGRGVQNPQPQPVLLLVDLTEGESFGEDLLGHWLRGQVGGCGLAAATQVPYEQHHSGDDQSPRREGCSRS